MSPTPKTAMQGQEKDVIHVNNMNPLGKQWFYSLLLMNKLDALKIQRRQQNHRKNSICI